MSYVVLDVYYRGYRIIWHRRQVSGTGLWTAQVAVEIPDESVYNVGESLYASSEEAARDYFVSMAKDWVDAHIANEKLLVL